VAQPATRDGRLRGRCFLDKETEKHRDEKQIARALAHSSCPAVVRHVAFFATKKGDAEVSRRSAFSTTFSWRRGEMRCVDF